MARRIRHQGRVKCRNANRRDHARSRPFQTTAVEREQGRGREAIEVRSLPPLLCPSWSDGAE